LVSSQASVANQDRPDSFRDYVSYKLGWNTLLLDPILANAASVKHDSAKSETIASISFTLRKIPVTVSFDPGPSDDPAFVISLGTSEEYLAGEKLYISSSGNFYLERKSNEYHEKRLKYSISRGTLVETRQPFYLIDQECEASTPVTIYTGKCNTGGKVATLPEGATVRILVVETDEEVCSSDLIADNEVEDPVDSYLVATPFGLVGWVASSAGDITRPGKPLACLQFFGD
jgi:hypothetical protein